MSHAATLDRRNPLLGYASALLAALTASQDGRPVTGELSFLDGWSSADRDRFLRGMSEALLAGIADDDPAPVEAFVRHMRSGNGARPQAPFDPSFLDRFEEQLDRHTQRR